MGGVKQRIFRVFVTKVLDITSNDEHHAYDQVYEAVKKYNVDDFDFDIREITDEIKPKNTDKL